MRVLLTGGTGFVGRHLVPVLAADHELFAICRSSPPAMLEGHAEWIEADLSSTLDPDRLPATIDAVAHIAQSRRYGDLPDGADDVFAVNVRSTFDLLEYARGAGATRFLLASSGGVYRRADRPLAEADPVAPLNLYFGSRLAAEQLVQSYAEFLEPLIARPFVIYGEGQREMMVARLAQRVLSGETVVIEGRPGLRVNPIHVADAVRAFEAALMQGSGTFNLAGDEIVSIAELVEMIADIAGCEPHIRHAEDGSPGGLIADNSRMKEVLGVTPQITLRDGLKATISSLRDTPEG